MPSRELYKRLRKEIDTIPVVDSHEHMFMPEADYLALPHDFAEFLFMYNLDDLITAGMRPPSGPEFSSSFGGTFLLDGRALDIDEKWAHIAPWWEQAKHTGYGRAVRLSIRRLFGVDELDSTTYRTISDKLKALAQPGVYQKILREICGFEISLNDVDTMVLPGMFERLDRGLFRFAARFRQFTYCYFPGGLDALEQSFDRSIRSLDHLVETIDAQFDRWNEDGRVALKLADAYMRDICYDDVPRDEAERVFMRLFTLRRHPRYPESLSYAEARPLENYILHRILERAEARNLPLIVHTGLQAYTGDDPSHSKASHLAGLFRKFPRLRFHLLHSNYPWMGEAAALAKQFPNVTLDLTWVHIIVPAGARAGLADMLDAVPVNKIHGFGGDCMSPVTIPGALEIARENITMVLAGKIESGTMTEKEAVAVAWKLLNENVRAIFGL